MPSQEKNEEKTPSSIAKNIERITVTANRKEMLDTELAMSVDSVGEAELAIDNGQHVAESLNSISGVLIDQLSGGQGSKAAIRMPINTSGYYLYLQDNIPLQSPVFFNHNALWWSSFNSNVARMEVLKGAGTALYGSGAVAATVNILSAPVAKTAQTNLNVQVGNDAYTKVQMSHSNAISSTQGFSVSGSYLTSDGWREHTGTERAEVSLRHEIELSGNEHLTTSLVISDLEQEMATSLSVDDFNNNRTSSGLSKAVLASNPLRKTQYVRLSTQWDKIVDNVLYSAIPYLRHRTNDYTATWNQNMPKIESEVNSLGLLALINIEYQDNSQTTMGVDFELTEGQQLSYQPIDAKTTGRNPDSFFAGEEFYNDTTSYTSISPYVQHDQQLGDDLTLSLGARYDYAKYDFDNHLGLYGDIGHGLQSLENRSDDFSHLSPKVSLNYLLNDTSSVYARYANSFRLPTASSLYHLTTKDSGEAKPVDPEVSDTYELGYKANFRTVSLDAAIYYMDVDDGIVHAYNNNGQRYLTNATRVIHKGFEAGLNWFINEEVNASIAYSKSKHIFDQHDDYSGNEMALAPSYITNFRLRYTPSYLTGFESMFELQSIGAYWLDDENSSDDEGNKRKYEGYTVANLKALYQLTKALSFNARLLNLTDKVYAQEAQYRYGKTVYAPGAPRTLYVGVNYQW